MISKKANSGGKFTEKQILKIMSEICEGLAYCHSKMIAYLDLKSKHIVITNKRAKICAFTTARIIQKTDEYIQIERVTPAYAAPEVFKGYVRPLPADIWSLGCIFYELCALNNPFSKRDSSESPDYDKTKLSNYSKELRSLIESMLQVNPIDRPTAKILLGNICLLYIILARMKALAHDEPTYSQSIDKNNLLPTLDVRPNVHHSRSIPQNEL